MDLLQEHQYKFQVTVQGRAQIWTLWATSYNAAVTECYRRLGANGRIVCEIQDYDPNGIDVL